MNLTTLAKYAVGLFGFGSIVATGNSTLGLIALMAYAILCYILGRVWYRFDLILAEREVENQFNLFQREVRDKLKSKRFK